MAGQLPSSIVTGVNGDSSTTTTSHDSSSRSDWCNGICRECSSRFPKRPRRCRVRNGRTRSHNTSLVPMTTIYSIIGGLRRWCWSNGRPEIGRGPHLSTSRSTLSSSRLCWTSDSPTTLLANWPSSETRSQRISRFPSCGRTRTPRRTGSALFMPFPWIEGGGLPRTASTSWRCSKTSTQLDGGSQSQVSEGGRTRRTSMNVASRPEFDIWGRVFRRDLREFYHHDRRGGVRALKIVREFRTRCRAGRIPCDSCASRTAPRCLGAALPNEIRDRKILWGSSLRNPANDSRGNVVPSGARAVAFESLVGSPLWSPSARFLSDSDHRDVPPNRLQVGCRLNG